MVQVIKTSVKCYKKKAKKKVGGKQKIYEYNQYLLPLKRSDNLECDEGVLIIPEKYFQDLFGLEDSWSVKEYISKLKGYEKNIEEYSKEFQDLKWKHHELSKSYKELVTKHTKSSKKYRMQNEEFNALKASNKKLEEENKELTLQLQSNKLEYDKLIKEQNGSSESKINEDESDKDKDIWSIIKNRLSKKEMASKED